jgi:hypothetical protein
MGIQLLCYVPVLYVFVYVYIFNDNYIYIYIRKGSSGEYVYFLRINKFILQKLVIIKSFYNTGYSIKKYAPDFFMYNNKLCMLITQIVKVILPFLKCT